MRFWVSITVCGFLSALASIYFDLERLSFDWFVLIAISTIASVHASKAE
jgi:hypothetical protein